MIHPIIQPLDQWTPGEKASRKKITAILEKLDIRFIDLLPVIERVTPSLQGIEVLQEKPREKWHPSAYLARQFANYLWEQQLLPGHGPTADPIDRRVAGSRLPTPSAQ